MKPPCQEFSVFILLQRRSFCNLGEKDFCRIPLSFQQMGRFFLRKKEARRPLFLFKQFRLFFFVFIVAFDSNGIECRYFIVAFQFLDLDA